MAVKFSKYVAESSQKPWSVHPLSDLQLSGLCYFETLRPGYDMLTGLWRSQIKDSSWPSFESEVMADFQMERVFAGCRDEPVHSH